MKGIIEISFVVLALGLVSCNNENTDWREMNDEFYRQIKCGETLRLIRKSLRSPIQIIGKLVRRKKGVLQGS